MIIGLIGAGNIGSAIAQNAIRQGHQVVLSNSRGPQTLAALISELGPQASAATAAEAGRAGDIVVVTVPLKNLNAVPVDPLAGKVVIDTNNYYFERDGHIAALDNGETGTAEMAQAHLPSSKVVKAFNQITSADLAAGGTPSDDPNRRALPIAGDDGEAKKLVTDLINSFGFDVVDAGPLVEGRRFERDKPAYGNRATVAEMELALAKG